MQSANLKLYRILMKICLEATCYSYHLCTFIYGENFKIQVL